MSKLMNSNQTIKKHRSKVYSFPKRIYIKFFLLMIIPKAKASIDGICQITRADLDHPNKNRYQEKKRQFFNQINGESDRATKEQNQGDKIG